MKLKENVPIGAMSGGSILSKSINTPSDPKAIYVVVDRGKKKRINKKELNLLLKKNKNLKYNKVKKTFKEFYKY